MGKVENVLHPLASVFTVLVKNGGPFEVTNGRTHSVMGLIREAVTAEVETVSGKTGLTEEALSRVSTLGLFPTSSNN